MERRILAYNEALLEIVGNPQAILALLPNTVSMKPVTAAMRDACVIPDLTPGFARNLARLSLDGQLFILSGCRPAVAFLLPCFAAARPDVTPCPKDGAQSLYFLTVPCAKPYTRPVACVAPRPANRRRGEQSDDLFA